MKLWTICLSIITLTLTSLQITSAASPSPIGDEPGHPRLFFDSAGLSQLREDAAASHQQLWQASKGYVDSQLGTTPPETAPLNGTEDDFRNFGDQLIPLAFACVITDEAQYCDLAKTYLLTYANWLQWDEIDRRDIGLAHMLVGNALGYDWLYSYMTPDERETVRFSLSYWAERMYEASAGPYHDDWQNWWYASYMNTNHWVNNSALGIAGMALKRIDDTAAPEATDAVTCVVTAKEDVSLRSGPGTSFPIVATLLTGQTATVTAQTTSSYNFVWWRTSDNQWVHADGVDESVDCAQVQDIAELNARVWIEQSVNEISRVNYLLNGIQDGSWHEGIDYQNDGLTMLLPYLVNLRQIEGVDLIPHDYLRNYPYWQLYNTLSDTNQFILSYGDFEWWWNNSFSPQNILRFAAGEYDDSHAEWLAEQSMTVEESGDVHASIPGDVFSYFYYDPSITAAPPDDLPGSRVFPDLSGAIWRTGWGANDIVFGLKTGSYGGTFGYNTFVNSVYPWDAPCEETGCTLNTSHDHADANSFYLYGAGQWLAPEDEGDGIRDSSSHNTILIDGENQFIPSVQQYTLPDELAGHSGRIEGAGSTSNFNYVAADAAPLYSDVEGLQADTRYALFLRPDVIVMLDNLAATSAHQYEWVSHFGQSVTVDGNWVRGVGENGGLLAIGIVAPEGFTTTIGDDGKPFIHIQPPSPVDSVRFINILYPTEDAHWEEKPVITLLSDDGQAAVVRVSRMDGRYDEVVFAYGTTDSFFDTRFYSLDGKVAAVSRSIDGTIQRFFSYGGTFLTDQTTGNTLASNLYGGEAFEGEYDGDTAAVSGNIVSAVTLYAPGVNHLTVNGQDTPFERNGDNIVFGTETTTAS